MAAPIKSNKKELAIARAMPSDEWFDRFHPAIAAEASSSYANRIIRRFKCVKLSRQVRLMYFISSEDKAMLIDVIENNPFAREFDTAEDDSTTDNMWHMLLGTKSTIKREAKQVNTEFESIYKREGMHG